ncbi:hypothetical protein D934_02760 [Xylella fastidiosa subsp. sandyi Ann-1]|uniref:Uncharacterized protein n=1 Tax=Xylella fastidiosa subsp. sandyi Ann-1 TaxID=155920 RepID=A0A060H2P1_XYLFS|nr:hypothetical protein D934_02760 [Xylella fastidiosa subsp. sandyi Ann-1]
MKVSRALTRYNIKTAVADLFHIGIALTMLEIESHTHFQSAFARFSSADIYIPMFLFQTK